MVGGLGASSKLLILAIAYFHPPSPCVRVAVYLLVLSRTGWMNSWIITMLSFRARNTSVWETTASEPFAGALRAELVSWAPYFFP